MSLVLAAATHSANVMNNKDMGSNVNRAKCSGERFKNNLKTILKAELVGAPLTVAGYALIRKPQIGVKATKYVGEGLKSLSKFVSKISIGKIPTGKFAAVLRLAGQKVVKAAPKYGRTAALAAVGYAFAIAMGRISRENGYNAGKIDQKYIDNAKIENMTNSVLV